MCVSQWSYAPQPITAVYFHIWVTIQWSSSPHESLGCTPAVEGIFNPKDTCWWGMQTWDCLQQWLPPHRRVRATAAKTAIRFKTVNRPLDLRETELYLWASDPSKTCRRPNYRVKTCGGLNIYLSTVKMRSCWKGVYASASPCFV